MSEPAPPAGDNAFLIEEPYRVAGTVVRTDTGTLRLTGECQFPTGGFAVGEVHVTLLKRLPEHVIFTIPVTPPSPDAMVTQAFTTVAVEADIAATEGATHEVRLEMKEPAAP